MRSLETVALALAVTLLPATALGAVCFRDEFNETLSLEIIGAVGGVISVSGRFVTNQLPVTDPDAHLPVTGVAFLRSDGNATIGLTVHGVSPNQSPFIIQGVLDGPFFNSGTGQLENVASGFTATVNWVPTNCPLFP
jgi:hypothetical protein